MRDKRSESSEKMRVPCCVLSSHQSPGLVSSRHEATITGFLVINVTQPCWLGDDPDTVTLSSRAEDKRLNGTAMRVRNSQFALCVDVDIVYVRRQSTRDTSLTLCEVEKRTCGESGLVT